MKLRRTLAGIVAATATAIAAPAMADWNGGYVGGYAGFLAVATDFAFNSGIQGGYSFSNGRIALGVEGEFGLLANAGGVAGTTAAAATMGFVVGERALFYAVGGAGFAFTLGGGAPFYSFGTGIEFLVGSRGMTMFIEPRAFGQPGPGGGCCAIQVQVGFNWRP